jgi:type II secretory pathway component PulM
MKDELQKVKVKWEQLAPREKQAVAIGGVFVAIFIAYAGIWAPLLNHVDNLREQITTDQKKLVWMQSADHELSKLEKQVTTGHSGVTPVVLLSQLQQQVHTDDLDKYMKALKQVSNHAIQMEFQQVEFDKLIPMLARVTRQHHIVISQLAVTADRTPGIVNATIVIKVD